MKQHADYRRSTKQLRVVMPPHPAVERRAFVDRAVALAGGDGRRDADDRSMFLCLPGLLMDRAIFPDLEDKGLAFSMYFDELVDICQQRSDGLEDRFPGGSDIPGRELWMVVDVGTLPASADL